jgi:hypothetical protein
MQIDVVTTPEFDQKLDEIRCLVLEVLKGRQDGDPWLDAKAAGDYLSMSPGAVQTAWGRQKLPCHLSETGQRRVRRSECDAYATAGDRA